MARMAETRDAYRSLVGKPEGKRLFLRAGVDGRIILKWIFEKCDGGMDCIDLTQGRDMWWVVVKVVMDFQVP